jgi:aspartate-semialdehyde dehydrogenase
LAKTRSIALLGGETLLGREVRDVLATAAPGLDLKLVAAEHEEAGMLTEQGGEPAVVSGLEEENLRGASAVLLAASPALTRRVLEMNLPAPLIDLTYAAEDDARARLRAPAAEPAGFKAESPVHVIAHPAAIALALLLNPLHARYNVRGAVAQIFEPASERGSKGLEELQQQTVGLLSFKSLPKAIFDAQLAFNLLARYGEEAPMALEDVELRIERHLATLLANSSRAPMPSLRLAQAPVFHGYSFSLWVDFEENPGVTALEKALAAAGADVRGEEMDPPDNVGVAGAGGIAVGAIGLDRNRPSACWIWMAADNLRLAAENAVAVAGEAE